MAVMWEVGGGERGDMGGGEGSKSNKQMKKQNKYMQRGYLINLFLFSFLPIILLFYSYKSNTTNSFPRSTKCKRG